jgi:glycerate dehydrogenase
MRIVVLDGSTLNPGDLSWHQLEELGSLEVYGRTDPAEIVQRSATAEVILTNKTPLTAETVKQLPALRYIGVTATGYNIVDIAAAKQLGITVTNIPTYGTDTVAQFAFALLLELCHQVGHHSDAVRAGEWTKSGDWCFWNSPQVELAGKTMGVVGFGRIGRRVGEIALAFGMKVIGYDAAPRNPLDHHDFRWADLEALLAESDVVSLHCPLVPETEGLINSNRLGLMKKTAFLLNNSRGPLVVEQDLADALNNGRLGGAAIDVLPEEPPRHGSVLFSARNCIVTPHISWAAKECRARLMALAIDNVRGFVSGNPINVVNP